MEPLRPVIDRIVLEFALSHAFELGDFMINRLGGCRLNPQMAKGLVNIMTKVNTTDVVRNYRYPKRAYS